MQHSLLHCSIAQLLNCLIAKLILLGYHHVKTGAADGLPSTVGSVDENVDQILKELWSRMGTRQGMDIRKGCPSCTDAPLCASVNLLDQVHLAGRREATSLDAV
jgi:hypothetical protein